MPYRKLTQNWRRATAPSQLKMGQYCIIAKQMHD